MPKSSLSVRPVEAIDCALARSWNLRERSDTRQNASDLPPGPEGRVAGNASSNQ
jgi:hypothetical protein